MKRDKTMMITFVTPALITFAMVFVYPTIRTIFMSLFYVQAVTDDFGKWDFVGIDNFIKLFSSQMFVQSLKNIFNIWFWGGIGVFAAALLLSIILTSGVKGKDFFRAAIYLPNVISAVAMATMWIHWVFSSKYGLLHNVFDFLGWENMAAVQWTSPSNQFASMTVAYCFGMVGYYVLIFMAGIEKIPKDFYEAAKLEGAHIFQQFRHITLPLMRAVMRSSIVMWSVSSIVFFIWSMMFSTLDPQVGTVTPMVYMYALVFGRSIVPSDPTLLNAGAGAAVGVIMTLIVLVIFGIVNLTIRDKKLQY